jgi:hypothetical protein
LVADLEQVVHRNGYLRVLAATVTVLGSIGLLGQLLGVEWLRYTFGILAAILFILASTVAFAATETLRRRSESRVKLLHEYADALVAGVPLSYRRWHQEVIIAPNGDADITCLVTFESSTGTTQRHVSLKLSYCGSRELTTRDRRRVRVKVHHADANGRNENIRVQFTSVWGTTSSRQPLLDIYAHLGPEVHEGDTIKVQWHWPRYSADLMRGQSYEDFDVVFRNKVQKASHVVIFRGVARSQSFSVRGLRGLKWTSVANGNDLKVQFSVTQPLPNVHYGFTADYKKHE